LTGGMFGSRWFSSYTHLSVSGAVVDDDVTHGNYPLLAETALSNRLVRNQYTKLKSLSLISSLDQCVTSRVERLFVCRSSLGQLASDWCLGIHTASENARFRATSSDSVP